MTLTIDDVSVFADGLDHPECVAVHPGGSLWAGGEGGQVYKISADGKSIMEVNNTNGFIRKLYVQAILISSGIYGNRFDSHFFTGTNNS